MSRVVILTESPSKEREMPKRAASSTPEDNSNREELRKLIERGVTRTTPAEKSEYYKSI